MSKISSEQKGELFVLGEMTLYSLFPIIISYATKLMPPIFFAGASIAVTSIALIIYVALTKQFYRLKNKKAVLYSLGVTIFITIIPAILIFIGTSKTSGINTSLLLQSEIIFTFIIHGLFKYEKITLKRAIGAVIVMAGTSAILYNGKGGINIGDLLIMAGTFFYPIGNIFAKKALKETTPVILLLIRNTIGAPILIGISLIFETYNLPIATYITNNIVTILLSGILVYCVSKILWYEGLKRIDINKAVLISVGGYPAISLLFAYVFLKEIPTTFQWLGFILILIGLLASNYKAKYASS